LQKKGKRDGLTALVKTLQRGEGGGGGVGGGGRGGGGAGGVAA